MEGRTGRVAVEELQGLLQRLFHASDNATKAHIEGVLKGLREADGAWREAELWMRSSGDAYVQWFGAAVLEETLRPHRWARVSSADRVSAREFIFSFLRTHYSALPGFVGTKLAKVAVAVGKADYPHHFPEFFAYLLALARDNSTRVLGLSMITIACDEFADTRGQTSATRRKELKQLFQQQMPVISGEWKEQLKRVSREYLREVKAELPDNIPPLVKAFLGSARYQGTLDRAAQTVVSTILEGISQAVGWLSPSDVLGSGLFDAVLPLTMLQDETGAQAVGLLGDLLERNYVPSDFQAYMGVLFQQTFTLLHLLTGLPPSADLPSAYVAKCNHFFWQFSSNYFGRIQKSDAFPAVEFLSLVYRYTFSQRTVAGFVSCVDIWSVILDAFGEPGQAADAATDAKFGPALEILAAQILRSSSFCENLVFLQSLDSTARTEDGETEQDAFLRKCRDLIIRAVEFFPRRLLQSFASSFATASAKFLAKLGADAPPYNAREWVGLAKDLGGLATIMGGLNSHFLSHRETTAGVLGLMSQFRELLAAIVQRSLHKQGAHFADLLAQTFAALAALMPWVEVQIGTHLDTDSEQSQLARRQAVLQALAPSLDVVAALLSVGASEPDVEAALEFFESVSLAVRVPQLGQIPGVQWLMANVRSVTDPLSPPLHSRLYTALACILLLPYKLPSSALTLKAKQQDEQHWGERTAAFEALMKPLVEPLAQAGADAQQLSRSDSAGRVSKALRALTGIATRVGERGGKESKQILVRGLEGAIRLGVPLLRAYLPHRQMAVVEAITQLFIALFDAFKTHLGLSFIQETMMAFIGVLGGEMEQLRSTFTSADAAAAAVSGRFLQLILHIVRDASPQLHGLVSDIRQLLFALPHSQLHDEVAGQYYEVVYELVLKHWNTTDSSKGQSVLVPSIQTFCEALGAQQGAGMDVTVVVQILKWLRDLGKRVKLFERPEFVQSGLRWRLTGLLLNLAAAVTDGAAALAEEAGDVLYDVALVDFGSFFREVLPAWIDQRPGLSIDQKRHLLALFPPDTDMTSFLTHLRDVASDIAFFHLLNSPPPTQGLLVATTSSSSS